MDGAVAVLSDSSWSVAPDTRKVRVRTRNDVPSSDSAVLTTSRPASVHWKPSPCVTEPPMPNRMWPPSYISSRRRLPSYRYACTKLVEAPRAVSTQISPRPSRSRSWTPLTTGFGTSGSTIGADAVPLPERATVTAVAVTVIVSASPSPSTSPGAAGTADDRNGDGEGTGVGDPVGAGRVGL